MQKFSYLLGLLSSLCCPLFLPCVLAEETLDSWDQSLLDDPLAEQIRLESRLEEIDYEKDTKNWLQHYWKWQRALNETSQALDSDGLPRFANQARKLSLDFIARDLERLSIDSLPAAQVSEQSSKTARYQSFLKELEQRPNPTVLSLAWLSFGLHYDAIGQAPLAMEAYKKAFTYLEKEASPSLLTRMNLMSSISVIFYNDGKFEQARDLKLQVINACKTYAWRHFCAEAYYNLGSMLTQQADSKLLKEAEESFRQGERLAQNIQSPIVLARINYGWLKYYTVQSDPTKALRYGLKAMKQFEKLKDFQFLSATRERLARVYFKIGDLETASQLTREAIETLEDRDFGRKKELFYLLYEIEKKRQKPENALLALETFTQILQMQSSQKEDADYNKLAADLGLKFEAEKSKALQAELKLQNTQRQAAFALLGLSLIAILLLFGYFRQIRLLQKLRYREKVDREREKAQKIIHLESELRFNLASSVAHRINNPLNQMNLSLELLSSNQEKLGETIGALFTPETEGDPELESMRKTLLNFLTNDRDLRDEIKKALNRTSSAISELRTLSGVDGCTTERYLLKDLCAATESRVRELISASDFERLTLSIPPEDSEKSFGGQIFVTKNALELLICTLLTACRGPLRLNFSRIQESILVIHYQGHLEADQTLFEALELSMSNVLRPSLLKAFYQPDQQAFIFKEYDEQTFPSSLQSHSEK